MPERGGEGVVHIVSDRPDQFTDLAIAIIIHLIFPRSRPLIWRQDRPSPHPQPPSWAPGGCAAVGGSDATVEQPGRWGGGVPCAVGGWRYVRSVSSRP